MIRLLLLGAYIAVVPAVSAAEPTWHLAIQAYSFHEHADGVRDETPGLGLMRRQGDWLLGSGVFRNSIGRWAGCAYVGWQKPVGRVRAGGIAGVTHHYRWNDGGIVPLAAAVVTVPVTSRWSLDLVGIPPISNVSYATLNISLSWQFR
jgi:hypothetical protein